MEQGTLKVIWLDARSFGDSSQHAGANLVVVMEGEDEVRPPGTLKRPVRARLPLDLPSDPKLCRQTRRAFAAGQFVKRLET